MSHFKVVTSVDIFFFSALTVLMSISIGRCTHGSAKREIKPVPKQKMVRCLFDEIHSSAAENIEKMFSISCVGSLDLTGKEGIPIAMTSTVGDLHNLGVKMLEFTCVNKPENKLQALVEKSVRHTNNAFERLMSGEKKYPVLKTSRYLYTWHTCIKNYC